MMEPGNDTLGQKSILTPNDWPPVTYLTMAYEPVNTRHAIINAIEQEYPGEKTIVLIHQKAGMEVQSNMPIQIINTFARGEWPALWLAKLEAFIAVADWRSVTVWWDEDDMFEPTYTMEAVIPIMHHAADGTWTDKTYYVKKGGIVEGTYPRSNGTLAIKTDVLKAFVPKVRETHPRGYRVVNGVDLTVDPTLVKLLGEHHNVKMIDHKGLRYYFLRSGGNGGPRRAGTGVNIDEV